jgi:UDP:flavonoid glycosyltransferase YjiC (YdhE family)
MRILIASSPGLGHFFPLVPLAWTARTAGHDVLVATTGPAQQAASSAGLNVVDAARDADIAMIFRGYMAGVEDRLADDPMHVTVDLFAQISDAMAAGTVAAARSWCPDIVIHSPLQGAGLLAAAAVGVPAVHHGLGFGYSAADMQRLQSGMREANGYGALAMARPDAVVDVCPPSMRAVGSLPGQPMRFIPYGGSGVLPDWLSELPRRPRVCLTLGSVLPRVMGIQGIRAAIDAVAGLPVDAVLALGSVPADSLGALPGNVTPVSWVPMDVLLPTCAAVVHHGGSGTCFNALVAGIPQLVMPRAGDQFLTAAAVGRRGVGIVVPHASDDPDGVASLIRELLDSHPIGAAVKEVSAEIAAMPPPLTLAGWLSSLASQRS